MTDQSEAAIGRELKLIYTDRVVLGATILCLSISMFVSYIVGLALLVGFSVWYLGEERHRPTS